MLIEIIEDYNKLLNKNCSYDNRSGFRESVAKSVKNKELDIIIVSDMFLTGFDAKSLNTLYYDKEQKYHNLIQSFSRTNRTVNSTKKYGNIICYNLSIYTSLV